MLDRQSLLYIIIGLCILNGLFSPYLNIAIPVTAVLLPEIFPRTLEWVLFWSSVMVASATLLFSGVPAALYERIVGAAPGAAAPMWIWLAGAAILTAPALLSGLRG